jgi:O-acetylserine/cysteine efflux transporter
MTTRDRLLGLSVSVLWGLNFLAIRTGLDYFPPIFFAAFRFMVIALPVVIFVRPPRVPIKWLILYGSGFGVVQFGLLFWAIDSGMPTGLSSVVLQAAVPFTVLLGAGLLGESLSLRLLLGICVAVIGMSLIAWDRAAHASVLPLLLTILAAGGWALGNIATRSAQAADPMRFTLWMTTIPPLPLLLLSAVVEGPTAGFDALRGSFTAQCLPTWVALIYLTLFGTVAAAGIWTVLMTRNPISEVAPFSLLVPVVGLTTAWVALHERPSPLALAGAVIVIIGCLGAIRVSPNPDGSSNSRFEKRNHRPPNHVLVGRAKADVTNRQ